MRVHIAPGCQGGGRVLLINTGTDLALPLSGSTNLKTFILPVVSRWEHHGNASFHQCTGMTIGKESHRACSINHPDKIGGTVAHGPSHSPRLIVLGRYMYRSRSHRQWNNPIVEVAEGPELTFCCPLWNIPGVTQVSAERVLALIRRANRSCYLGKVVAIFLFSTRLTGQFIALETEIRKSG